MGKYWSTTEKEIIIKCGLEEIVKDFFQAYAIVWHDPNLDSQENQIYIAELEKFCQVKRFTEWQKASVYIQETKTIFHVITSGTNGEALVKEISTNENIKEVYIFCRNKEFHSA